MQSEGVCMLKSIIRSFFIVIFVTSSTFADDTLSTFNQQGDINYPEPMGEENYFATKAPLPSESFGYFGINIAGGLTSLKPAVAGSASSPQNSHALNFSGGLYGGYGINFSHFYIGTELSATYNALNKSTSANGTSGSVQLSVKQPIIVGLDLIPGYITASRSVLFYGRLGLAGSLIQLGFTDPVNNNTKTNKLGLGLRAGLGIEYFMGDTFSLRTEYIYNSYNKVSGSDITQMYSYNTGTITANQINLGLSIHF